MKWDIRLQKGTRDPMHQALGANEGGRPEAWLYPAVPTSTVPVDK